MSGNGWVARPRDLEVVTGERREVQVTLAPAIRQTLRVHLPEGRFGSLKFAVHGAGGESFLEWKYGWTSLRKNPYDFKPLLPAAAFVASFTIDDRPPKKVPFQVKNVRVAGAAIVVDLR